MVVGLVIAHRIDGPGLSASPTRMTSGVQRHVVLAGFGLGRMESVISKWLWSGGGSHTHIRSNVYPWVLHQPAELNKAKSRGQ